MKFKFLTMTLTLMAVIVLTIFGCGSNNDPVYSILPVPDVQKMVSTTTTQGVDAANVVTSTSKTTTLFSYDNQDRLIQCKSTGHIKFGNISSTTTEVTNYLAFDPRNNFDPYYNMAKDVTTETINGAVTNTTTTTNVTQFSYRDNRLLSAITATVVQSGNTSKSLSKTKTYSYQQTADRGYVTDRSYIVTEVISGAGSLDGTSVSTYDNDGNIISKIDNSLGTKTSTSYIYNPGGYISTTEFSAGKIITTTLGAAWDVARSTSTSEIYNLDNVLTGRIFSETINTRKPVGTQ